MKDFNDNIATFEHELSVAKHFIEETEEEEYFHDAQSIISDTNIVDELPPSIINSPQTPISMTRIKSRPEIKISIPSTRNSQVSFAAGVIDAMDVTDDITEMENIVLENKDSCVDREDSNSSKRSWSISKILFNSKPEFCNNDSNSNVVLLPSECVFTSPGSQNIDSKRKGLLPEELNRFPLEHLSVVRDSLIRQIQTLSTVLIDRLESREISSAQNAEFRKQATNLLKASLESKKFRGRNNKSLAMNLTVGSYYSSRKI